MITGTTLERRLSYNPDTGIFIHIADVNYNARAGDCAGWRDHYGYMRVAIERRSYLVHRLAWLWCHGRWPTKFIDHINGIRDDNRIANLREVTGAQNQANRRPRRDSVSGFRGVRFQKNTGLWAAHIQIGSFKTKEEAYAAYCKLADICHGDFAAHRGVSLAPEMVEIEQ